MKARSKLALRAVAIQHEERRRTPPGKPSGVRAAFWHWLSGWDCSLSGFEAMPYPYESLNPTEAAALHSRFGERPINEACRCLMGAALRTVPDYLPGQTAKVYTRPQLLALAGLRLWLGVGHNGVISHLEKHPRDQFLIFGESKLLPTPRHLMKFEEKLTPEIWTAYAANLDRYNPGLAGWLRSTFK